MSRWKKANWDKWTFWHKVRHVLAVIGALLASGFMVIFFIEAVLYMFGLAGFIMFIRDKILLEIMHAIFG